MDATPHLVVGAALGRRLHPVLGFAVELPSHVVLDAIPHWNYTGWNRSLQIMMADGLVGGLLALAKYDAAEIGPPWSLVTQIGVVLVALAIGLRRARQVPRYAVTWGGSRR